MSFLCPHNVPTLNNSLIRMKEKSYNGKTFENISQLRLYSLKNKILNIKWLNT